MITLTARMLPMLALALATGLATAGGIARADDAMKPAGAMKADGGMMKADAMKTDDGAMADCKEKAGMETDQMKKDQAMQACDDAGMMKSGAAMKPDNAMKPATSN
jgi:hypothetical protein